MPTATRSSRKSSTERRAVSGAGAGVGAAVFRSRHRGRMERSQQDHRRRLHDSLQLLDRNFQGLISAAQVDLKSGSSAAADHDRERLQIDLNTANIVKAGEQLLQLVDSLKLPIITNDFER